MSGLEVHGLEETLGLLLDMAVAVHSRCALSTAALLDMLDKGRARSFLWSVSTFHACLLIWPCNLSEACALSQRHGFIKSVKGCLQRLGMPRYMHP